MDEGWTGNQSWPAWRLNLLTNSSKVESAWKEERQDDESMIEREKERCEGRAREGRRKKRARNGKTRLVSSTEYRPPFRTG